MPLARCIEPRATIARSRRSNGILQVDNRRKVQICIIQKSVIHRRRHQPTRIWRWRAKIQFQWGENRVGSMDGLDGVRNTKEGMRAWGRGCPELSNASNSNGGRKRDSNCRVREGKWKFGLGLTGSPPLIGLASSMSYSSTLHWEMKVNLKDGKRPSHLNPSVHYFDGKLPCMMLRRAM